MGQWVRNKHNFTFGEALERISHVARLEQIEVDEDSPLFNAQNATSRRQKLFWLEINGMVGMRANMRDYGSVSDAQLKEAWAAGLSMVRDRALTVGMVPVLKDAHKWEAPWPVPLSESESLAGDLITDEDLEDIGAASEPRAAALEQERVRSAAVQPAGETDKSARQQYSGLQETSQCTRRLRKRLRELRTGRWSGRR
jgi:hypothetical protein